MTTTQTDKPAGQKKSEECTSVFCNLEADQTQWAAPEWCGAGSIYSSDEDTPLYAGAVLVGQDLSGRRLIMAEFNGVDARKIKLHRSELSGADFREADLREANMMEADLCSVDFSDANLRGACLIGADLTVAVLANADLCGADLSGACLEGAKLHGAIFDDSTQLPFEIEIARQLGMKHAHEGARE